jgi:hypothetical protein
MASTIPDIFNLTIRTQSYGAAESVSKLGQKRCSILLIHGTDDNVLPRYVHLVYIIKQAILSI